MGDMTSILSMMEANWASTMSNYNVRDLIFILFGTLFLSAGVGFLYRYTHKGTNYNQGFVQTLVMMGGIIAVIMLIVGSDVAKAFTMMGAFSIIRFRNTMKETRDIGFVFLIMAIGMAMGTKLYLLAGGATLVLGSLLRCMRKWNRFSAQKETRTLVVAID